jgi:hypothetical protein
MGLVIHSEYNLRVLRTALPLERQVMTVIKNKHVGEALRRDVVFVWHAVIAVVFIGFASLAVAAALLDILSFRH